MRIVVVSKGSGKGTGVSQATRYVSRRERDETREGTEARRLFSAQADDLGCHRANLVLGDGRAPQTKDVLHLVVSFAHEEDFLSLGEDEPARQQAVQEITRATLAEMTEQLQARELRWVAGIHRNTEHPHVHLLLQRAYTEKGTGRDKYLKTLPSDWRVSWEKTARGERQINPGSLSETFEHLLVEQLTRNPSAHPSPPQHQAHDLAAKTLQQEREVLGRAWLAQDGLDRLVERQRALAQFGAYRRYSIVDERGQKRWLSEHDLRQSARGQAVQLAGRLQMGLSADERQVLQQQLFERERARRANSLAQIEAARTTEQQSLSAQQERWQLRAQPVLLAAEAIKQCYAAREETPPVPQLSRAALAHLQEQALQRGDAARFAALENIRLSLAQERRESPRTRDEMARLAAQLFLGEAGLRAEQKAAVEFAATKHLRRWAVGQNSTSHHTLDKTTLAATERALKWEMEQAKFIGARRLHWDDEKRAEARLRVAELTEQRVEIQRQIADRERGYAERAERQQELVKTLSAIHVREAERLKTAGQSLPAARFTDAEWRTLDTLADRRGDPAFYRTLIQLERQHDEQYFPVDSARLAERTGRVLARVVMAEIAQREAVWQRQTFTEKREQADVLVREKAGEGMATARLADVAPRARWERAFPSFVTRRESYQTVAAALAEHESRLTRELERATAARAVLTAAAQHYAAEFQQQFPAQSLPRPAFLPAELQRLETYLSKEPDTAVQQRYQALYHEALATERGAESRLPHTTHHPLIAPSPDSASEAMIAPTESLAAYLPRATALDDPRQQDIGMER